MPNNKQQGQYTAADVQQPPTQTGQYTAADVAATQSNATQAQTAPQPDTGPFSAAGWKGFFDRPVITESGLDTAADGLKFLAKGLPVVAGAAVAPELVPEAGWLAHALITGVGGGVGSSVGQAITGQNPFSGQSAVESGSNAMLMGLTDGLFGALPRIAGMKFGRSLINESMQATGRDVTYGNPAKALLDEGISTPFTGDIEATKGGAGLGAAGGRLGAVSQRISELQPQLSQALQGSPKMLKVADLIDAPLTKAFNDIMDNSAMTDAEKMNAIGQLGGLQASLKSGLGDEISTLKANQLKELVGSRIRWNGTNAVGDEVRPAYKAVYASLKSGVNGAVPEAAELNERLTNLYAAQDDLVKTARNEEVSRGAGPTGGKIGTNLLGRAESSIGKFLPGIAAGSQNAGAAVKGGISPVGTILGQITVDPETLKYFRNVSPF